MALPGGRTSLADASPMAVAVRETREEVGLELMPCQYLGALAEIPLVGAPRPGWWRRSCSTPVSNRRG